MTVYTVGGLLTGTGFLCIKPSATLAIKVLRVDAIAASSYSMAVFEYTGGGVITGGTTPVPVPLRAGAPTALFTAKLTATAVSGTQNTFQGTTNFGANSVGSYTPPSPLILGAGSSSVLAVSSSTNVTLLIHVDEQRLQGGF